MKKFVLFSFLFITIFLFSYKDYGGCSGSSSGHKALTCGACHGGIVSDDIYILDGKTDVEFAPAQTVFTIPVQLPAFENPFLQIETHSADKVNTYFNILNKKPIRIAQESTLFETSKLTHKNTQTLYLEVAVDNHQKLPTNIILQGVVSDGDGTMNGDQSFYKEIDLNDFVDQAANKKSIYYYNNQLHFKKDKLQSIAIIDISGKVLIKQQTNQTIDVSELPQGKYFVTINGKRSEFSFVK